MASAAIDVTRAAGDTFEVRVTEHGGQTTHRVTLKPRAEAEVIARAKRLLS